MEALISKVGLFDDLVFRFFGRLIARQFVVFGGVPAALRRGEKLLARGVVPTYNRIDEHVHSRGRVEEILASYVALVTTMDYVNYGNVAIKPSAFGMELGSFVFARTLRRFIDAVSGKYLEIEIDAERHETLCAVQFALNSLARKLPKGIVLRPALQMHLPDELYEKLITELNILDMPLRIVKGSELYGTSASRASDTEMLARYYETFRQQIGKRKNPNAATVRDKKLLKAIVAFADSEHVPSDRFGFQFLDGPFGRSLARKYAALGYRVGCYVTFVDSSAPDEWQGYVRRRIAFGRKLLFGK
ncbi:MAG: hypothetical protein AAB869_02680 [Patescibacteria group bacterium]